MKRFTLTMTLCVLLAGSTALASLEISLQPGIVDFLSTPDTSGIISHGGDWGPNGDGYSVMYTVTQNLDMSWHYKYEFGKENGDPLAKLTSHFIISLSDNILPDDLYNFGVDIEDMVFGTFASAPGNPGFPEGKTIFGAKFDLWNDQQVVEFDSNRQPMWGDFYGKSGKSDGLWNYAYNTDVAVVAINQNNYLAAPVDAFGSELHKILVPDTAISVPVPSTLLLFGFGVLMLTKRS